MAAALNGQIFSGMYLGHYTFHLFWPSFESFFEVQKKKRIRNVVMQLKRWLRTGLLSREFVRITDNKSRYFPKDFGSIHDCRNLNCKVSCTICYVSFFSINYCTSVCVCVFSTFVATQKLINSCFLLPSVTFLKVKNLE